MEPESFRIIEFCENEKSITAAHKQSQVLFEHVFDML